MDTTALPGHVGSRLRCVSLHNCPTHVSPGSTEAEDRVNPPQRKLQPYWTPQGFCGPARPAGTQLELRREAGGSGCPGRRASGLDPRPWHGEPVRCQATPEGLSGLLPTAWHSPAAAFSCSPWHGPHVGAVPREQQEVPPGLCKGAVPTLLGSPWSFGTAWEAGRAWSSWWEAWPEGPLGRPGVSESTAKLKPEL